VTWGGVVGVVAVQVDVREREREEEEEELGWASRLPLGSSPAGDSLKEAVVRLRRGVSMISPFQSRYPIEHSGRERDGGEGERSALLY